MVQLCHSEMFLAIETLQVLAKKISVFFCAIRKEQLLLFSTQWSDQFVKILITCYDLSDDNFTTLYAPSYILS